MQYNSPSTRQEANALELVTALLWLTAVGNVGVKLLQSHSTDKPTDAVQPQHTPYTACFAMTRLITAAACV